MKELAPYYAINNFASMLIRYNAVQNRMKPLIIQSLPFQIYDKLHSGTITTYITAIAKKLPSRKSLRISLF